MADNNLTVLESEEEELNTLVRFSKTYHFEGKDYSQIDLAGMDTLTSKDMVDAEKYLFKTGTVSALPDQTVAYSCFIASRISDQPIEFFMQLRPVDMIRVKNKITSFFYNTD